MSEVSEAVATSGALGVYLVISKNGDLPRCSLWVTDHRTEITEFYDGDDPEPTVVHFSELPSAEVALLAEYQRDITSEGEAFYSQICDAVQNAFIAGATRMEMLSLREEFSEVEDTPLHNAVAAVMAQAYKLGYEHSIKMVRIPIDQVQQGERFFWHNSWYLWVELPGGRQIAHKLKPNRSIGSAPQGAGHSMHTGIVVVMFWTPEVAERPQAVVVQHL